MLQRLRGDSQDRQSPVGGDCWVVLCVVVFGRISGERKYWQPEINDGDPSYAYRNVIDEASRQLWEAGQFVALAIESMMFPNSDDTDWMMVALGSCIGPPKTVAGFEFTAAELQRCQR